MTFQARRPLANALIVDDDVPLLDTWTRLIEANGLTAETADSWESGLTAFHVLSPELVIADYNLPGSAHGLKLLAEVRRLRPTVRLILISGVVEPSQLAAAESLGIANRVLSKGDSDNAIDAIIEEIRSVTDDASSSTDWALFADAWTHAASIDSVALEELDRLLSSSTTSRP
jgi:ActR/RegA family two-component response regulator